MSENEKPKTEETPTDHRPRRPIPQGYRQGIITAITVLLGFSLGFLRFWGFEAPGQWTYRSFVPAVTLVMAVVLQIIALYRALRLVDDEEHEYQKTVKWLIASAVVLLLGLTLAALEIA